MTYVVDTCTFLDYLVLLHQHEHGTPWPNSKVNSPTLATDLDRRNFEALLKQKACMITTVCGVVSELQVHITKARKEVLIPQRPLFMSWAWRVMSNMFRIHSIDEIQTPLPTLPIPAIATLGPVDIGIVEAAKQIVANGGRATVLTGDKKIRRRCIAETVSAPFVTDAIKLALGI